jgi:hypothetical protein
VTELPAVRAQRAWLHPMSLPLHPAPTAVLRNMSNGYKHQRAPQDAEAGSGPKRRRTPSAASPGGGGGEGVGLPAVRRGGEGGEGGADERNVVELETDADGMDDGYRWVQVECGETGWLPGHGCLAAAFLPS